MLVSEVPDGRYYQPTIRPVDTSPLPYSLPITPQEDGIQHFQIMSIDPSPATDSPQVDYSTETFNTSPSPLEGDNFPEGGFRAWSVVVGAFLILFPSFGLMVSIGTLQEYWHSHQLMAYTTRDVGWIP